MGMNGMGVDALILENSAVARECLHRVVAESFGDVDGIDEATGAGDALQRLQRRRQRARPYDLVLLDLEHPDGRWSELLGLGRDAARVWIVCTLFADDEHLFRALQAGADGYLLKEDRFEVQVEQMQRLARGLPPLTPGIARRALSCLQPGRVTDDRLLTEREASLLTAASRGFTLREIARQDKVKWQALHAHVRSVYRKLAGRGLAPDHSAQGGLAGPD